MYLIKIPNMEVLKKKDNLFHDYKKQIESYFHKILGNFLWNFNH